MVMPYAALLYNAEGKTYVYTSPKPLHYVQAEVRSTASTASAWSWPRARRRHPRRDGRGRRGVRRPSSEIAGSH